MAVPPNSIPASRRTFLCGLASLALVGGGVSIVSNPEVFDPVLYISDLRRAGYILSTVTPVPLYYGAPTRPSRYGIEARDGEGFGPEYERIMFKWAAAQKADPDANARVYRALMAEWALTSDIHSIGAGT